MNKTDFRIDCDKFHMIIILNTQKKLRLTNSKNRNYVSDIEIISVANECIFSMLILKDHHILFKWILNNDFDDETFLNVSEIEYSNDDLVLKWLKHFIKHVEKKRVDRYILLIIDEFESHMIYFFWRLITNNNIFLFRLSAHFTHLI